MKKARPEALSGYIFVIFHLKVYWGWYCVTGDMRKDWPRCIPNRSKIEEKTGPGKSKHIFLDLALEWDLELSDSRSYSWYHIRALIPTLSVPMLNQV